MSQDNKYVGKYGEDPLSILKELAQIDYELAERSFMHFFKAAWHILEPTAPMLLNWHQEAIAEYLEAVYAGDIKRLIINMPPRYSKSLLVTVMFPAWCWVRDASMRFINASYAEDLAVKHAVDRRILMQSDWYQAAWSHKFKFSTEQNQKSEYINDKRGHCVAAGMLGAITGKGADVCLIDDPHNPKKAESDAERKSAVEAFDSTFTTRLDNKKTGRIIVVMQRLHHQDLTGHLLRKRDQGEHWTHLKLPAIQPKKTVVVFPISKRKVFRDEGDILHPDREGPKELAAMKVALGTYNFCTPAESPILMADLTMKPIGEIKIGDQIIGFETDTEAKVEGTTHSRRGLVVTEVKAISKSVRDVVKITLDSGKVIRSTADHNWYMGRGGNEGVNKDGSPRVRPLYREARVGRKLMRVCNDSIPTLTDPDDIRLAGWLAGFFDGEGSVVLQGNSCNITFVQGTDRNKILCEKLESTLRRFGFDYNFNERVRSDRSPESTSNNRMRYYWLRGKSLSLNQKFLHVIQPTKWRERLAAGALGDRFIEGKERVVKIEADGRETVYGLTTTTGNYVVWGMASSNSGQYEQNPTPRAGGIFKKHYWRYYLSLPAKIDEMIQTWDMSFKDLLSSDYVAGFVLARCGADIYVVDCEHNQLAFKATYNAVIKMSAKHPRATRKLVEDKANGTAVMNALKGKIPGLVAVNPLGSKMERAALVEPLFEGGNIHLPHPHIAQKWVQDLIDEAAAFPKGEHDDMVDALTQGVHALMEKNMDRMRALGML